jgi:hypothetical protein
MVWSSSRSSTASAIHCRTHFTDGLPNSHEHRSRNDGVADVQLFDFADLSHLSDIGERQSVAGVYRETEFGA